MMVSPHMPSILFHKLAWVWDTRHAFVSHQKVINTFEPDGDPPADLKPTGRPFLPTFPANHSPWRSYCWWRVKFIESLLLRLVEMVKEREHEPRLVCYLLSFLFLSSHIPFLFNLIFNRSFKVLISYTLKEKKKGHKERFMIMNFL